MPKNKVNNNIKLKSGGGIIDGPDGFEVDETLHPLYSLAFPTVTSTGTAAEVLSTGNLYRVATAGAPGNITTAANGDSTGNDFDSQNTNYGLMAPLDLSAGYYKLNSTTITFGTVTVGGNVTVKLYEYFNTWNNADTAATLAGKVEKASTTLAVSSTGTKTFTFSSPPILDFVNHKYALEVIYTSGTFSNVSNVFGGSSMSISVGHGYKWFNTTNGGSTWVVDYQYIKGLTINVDTEVVGAIYKASTTIVDGIVTAGGAIGSTVELQSAGPATLSTVVAGKMYYSDGSGVTTTTPDGTKMSIGLGVDTDKLLIIKGIK